MEGTDQRDRKKRKALEFKNSIDVLGKRIREAAPKPSRRLQPDKVL